MKFNRFLHLSELKPGDLFTWFGHAQFSASMMMLIARYFNETSETTYVIYDLKRYDVMVVCGDDYIIENRVGENHDQAMITC